jgi:hypothetical protein
MNQTTTKRPALAAEKPRRPLSCFNLFYRYKRTLVFDAHHSGTASDDVAIKQIIREAAGTEESPMAHLASLSEAERNVLRRAKIRSVLEHNLLPNTSPHLRSHRKALGGLSMTFVEMGKLMTESWKTVDPYAKDVFCELASEGKLVYRQLMDEYYAASKTLPPGGGKKPTFRYKPSLKSPPVRHESKHALKRAKTKADLSMITTRPSAPIVSPSVMPSLVHVPSSRMASLPHDVSTPTFAEDDEELPFLPTSVSTEDNEELPFLPTSVSTYDNEELPFLPATATASLFEEDEAQLRTEVARWRMTDVARWRMMPSLSSSLYMHVGGVLPIPFFTTNYSPSSSNRNIQETGYEMFDSMLEMKALQQQGISAGDFMTFVTKLAEE